MFSAVQNQIGFVVKIIMHIPYCAQPSRGRLNDVKLLHFLNSFQLFFIYFLDYIVFCFAWLVILHLFIKNYPRLNIRVTGVLSVCVVLHSLDMGRDSIVSIWNIHSSKVDSLLLASDSEYGFQNNVNIVNFSSYLWFTFKRFEWW